MIRAAADVARRAPSSHNCQPWTIAVGPCDRDGLRFARVTINPRTRLRALPSLDAEMAISLGLFLAVFRRMLDRMRLPCAVCETLPDGVVMRVGPALEASLAGGADFAGAVRRRRANRGPFLPSAISPERLRAMLDTRWGGLGLGAPAAGELYMEQRSRAAVAALIRSHGALDFLHRDAWRETYRHIRFAPAEEVVEGVGFSIDSLLGPQSPPRRQMMRTLLHPLTMQALRPLGLPRRMAGALAGLVEAAPGLLVLVAPESEPCFADLLETGQRLAEIWHAAEDNGIQLHPLSVLLQHARPRRDLRDALGLSGHPLFLARIGEAARAAAPTPRLALDEVLSQTGPVGPPDALLVSEPSE
jgi:hypothetical protein